jgi:hypothetical protein
MIINTKNYGANTTSSWYDGDQCYNYLRRKNGVFLEKQCYHFLHELVHMYIEYKTPFFADFFWKILLKVATLTPGLKWRPAASCGTWSRRRSARSKSPDSSSSPDPDLLWPRHKFFMNVIKNACHTILMWKGHVKFFMNVMKKAG